MIDYLNNLDTQLFFFLNGINSGFWDHIMWWVSGKEEWIPLYLIILGWIIYRFRWKTLFLLPFIILLVVLSDQISVFIKSGVQRYRPTHEPLIKDLVHIVNNYRGGLYGFVSSHAANSFALAAFTLMLFKNRWFTIFILFWASLVSYSRIYLGVHYPGDILFGGILGAGIGLGIYWLFNMARDKFYPQGK